MSGARPDVEELHYRVSTAAERYGASVAQETTIGDEAYADRPGLEFFRLPWPVW